MENQEFELKKKIVHLPTAINDYEAGYYFQDETDRIVGPHNSFDEALEELKKYVAQL